MFDFWVKDGKWPAPEFEFTSGTPHALGLPALGFFGAAESWIVKTGEALGVQIDPLALNMLVFVSGLLDPVVRVAVQDKWEEPARLWGAHVSQSQATRELVTQPFVSTLQVVVAHGDQEQGSAKGARKAELLKCEADHASLSRDSRANLVVLPKAGTSEAYTWSHASTSRPIWVADLAGYLAQAAEQRKLGSDSLAIWPEAWDGRPVWSHRERVADNSSRNSGAILASADKEHLTSGAAEQLGTDCLSRFLYVCEEDSSFGRVQQCDEPLDPLIRALQRVHRLHSAQINKARAAPITLPLDDRAHQQFNDWRITASSRYAAETGVFNGWTNRMFSQALRIALALEMIDWAFGTEANAPEAVGPDAMDRAMGLVECWLLVHARHLFCLPNRTAGEAYAAEFAAWISRWRPPLIKPRDLLAGCKIQGIRTPEAMNAACHELVNMAWMAPVGAMVDYRATFIVNPRLLEILTQSS
jgi:hypothetical protein